LTSGTSSPGKGRPEIFCMIGKKIVAMQKAKKLKARVQPKREKKKAAPHGPDDF